MRSISTLLTILVTLNAGCEVGKGPQPIFPDGKSLRDDAAPLDQRAVEPDLVALPDQRVDQEAPMLDRGLPGTDVEALADVAVEPDSAVGPSPPFGSTVGMTAANFSIFDCGSDLFELHAQYDKYSAVVMLYSYTSFT